MKSPAPTAPPMFRFSPPARRLQSPSTPPSCWLSAGIAARVVSVPCFELFLQQPEAARRAVIGKASVNVGVEAAVRQGWDAIIGSDGVFVGMNSFGASAPYKELYKKFGITAEAVADAAQRKLAKS